MKTRKMRRVAARYKWDRLKVSFWFAPVVLSLGAILLGSVAACGPDSASVSPPILLPTARRLGKRSEATA